MNLKLNSFQKKAGIFYTPEYITEFMVKNAIFEYILTFFEKRYQTIDELILSDNLDDLKKLNNIIIHLKILDPACGAGIFLLKSGQILLELTNKIAKRLNLRQMIFKKRVDIIEKNLYGVDIFEESIQECKSQLKKWLISNNQLNLNNYGNKNINFNLKVGNSLIGRLNEEINGEDVFNKNLSIEWKPFHWSKEFPEIIKNGGFDIILENPPYIFTRGGNFSTLQKTYFRNFISKLGLIQSQKGKQFQSNKLNTYSLFILRSLELLKKGAKLAVLIPNNFLRNTNLDIYRDYILRNYCINQIVDLSNSVFRNVVASIICLFIDKKKPDGEFKTQIISNIEDLNENIYTENKIAQSSFLKNKSYVINIHLDETSRKICKYIVKNSINLGEITEYIIEGIICSKKRDIYETRLKSIDMPFLEGKNIDSYITKWSGKFIRYDRENLHRARSNEVFTSNKLIIQRISGGTKPLKANYDPGVFYTFSSINNIIINEEYRKKIPLKLVLLILNSNLMNWYYAINFTNKSELTVNISKTFLEEIPVVKPKNKSLFENIADYLMFLFQYYNIKNEKLIFTDDIIQFFYVLSNGIIYELYLKEKIKSNLIIDLENKLTPIRFEDWIQMKFNNIIFNKKFPDFEKIEKENLEKIKNVYHKLVKDNTIQINLKKIYKNKWIKFIERGVRK